MLEILKVDIERLKPITQPTTFENIILPDESFFAERKYGAIKFTKEYREVIDRVKDFALKNRTPTSSKKFYFFYGRRGQIGEERLAKYFKSKGYEVILPEKRTFDEQLNILINCESFASTLGSCAHNALFLREGTETIVIPREIHGYNFYQLAIDQVSLLNTTYIDSTFSLFHKMPCFIISEQLKRFFGDKFDGYEKGDFKAFLDYVTSPARKGHKIIPRQPEGYGSVFSDFMEQLKRCKDLTMNYSIPEDLMKWRPLLNYQAHVASKGWHDGWKSENEFSNPLDQNLEVLAIKLNYPNHKVYYSVYFNDAEGWSEEVQAPEMAGTVGKRKPIFGMRIRLDEAGTKNFDILYRMHKLDDTWTPWAKNGEALYSYGVKLNAIQVKLQPKSDAAKI